MSIVNHKNNNKNKKRSASGGEPVQEKRSRWTLAPMSCRRPLWRNQAIVLDRTVGRDLSVVVVRPDDGDSENYLCVMHNFVRDNSKLQAYIDSAARVERHSTKSGYGRMPREQICYTHDGKPYQFSGTAHPTTQFPEHVKQMDLCIRNTFPTFGSSSLALAPHLQADTAADLLYSSKFPRGGSIAPHKDDENPDWAMVAIFSLGQTRWLRVRSERTKQFTNVELTHNSLVCMVGPTFQQRFTHQIDKLHAEEPVGTRHSLNIRYVDKRRRRSATTEPETKEEEEEEEEEEEDTTTTTTE
jgi:alkylated DNA repair dioxygenase AlkB